MWRLDVVGIGFEWERVGEWRTHGGKRGKRRTRGRGDGDEGQLASAGTDREGEGMQVGTRHCLAAQHSTYALGRAGLSRRYPSVPILEVLWWDVELAAGLDCMHPNIYSSDLPGDLIVSSDDGGQTDVILSRSCADSCALPSARCSLSSCGGFSRAAGLDCMRRTYSDLPGNLIVDPRGHGLAFTTSKLPL